MSAKVSMSVLHPSIQLGCHMNSLEPIGAPRWSLPLVISTPVPEANINSRCVVVVRFLSVQGAGGYGIVLSLSLLSCLSYSLSLPFSFFQIFLDLCYFPSYFRFWFFQRVYIYSVYVCIYTYYVLCVYLSTLMHVQ